MKFTPAGSGMQPEPLNLLQIKQIKNDVSNGKTESIPSRFV